MIAVSNTTPLRYLIAIGQDDLLGKLFEKVFVPTGVHEELTDLRTPEDVRRRELSLAAWFEVRAVQQSHEAAFPVTLHLGEREAILLAEARRADVLLVDEQIGGTIALSRKLPLRGRWVFLERADRMGFVSEFPQILQRLKASEIHEARALLAEQIGRFTLER